MIHLISKTMQKTISSTAIRRIHQCFPHQISIQTWEHTTRHCGKRCLLRPILPYAQKSLQLRQLSSSPSFSLRCSSPNAASQSPEAATQSTNSSAEEPSSSSAINVPDITTHYTMFPKTIPNGPPPSGSFDISLRDLRREFLALQGLAHPDKFPEGPSKRKAEALSSRINEAYRALSDPLSRAQYLLASQHDIDVTAEDGANKHPQSPETLMQVMDVQEAVEEAEDETVITGLKVENEERIMQTVDEMGRAFETGDIDVATKLCSKLKFWYTIRDGLREWEPGSRSVRLVH